MYLHIQMRKTILPLLIMLFVLMMTLPVYSAKLVEEEEIRNPKTEQQIPPNESPDHNRNITAEGEAKSESIRNDVPVSKVKKETTQNITKKSDKNVPDKSDSWPWKWIIIIAIVIIALFKILEMINREIKMEERKKKLIEKYGEGEGLDIFNEKIWIGMTTEQLIDSWGKPDDTKEGAYQWTFYYGERQGPRGGVSYHYTVTIKNRAVYNWREN